MKKKHASQPPRSSHLRNAIAWRRCLPVGMPWGIVFDRNGLEGGDCLLLISSGMFADAFVFLCHEICADEPCKKMRYSFAGCEILSRRLTIILIPT